MATGPHFLIDQHGPGALQRSIACHSLNFDHDPVLTYILHDWPEERRVAYIRTHFWRRLLTAGSLQGATFDEAHLSTPDPPSSATVPSASAVWYPPGAKNLAILPFLRAGLPLMIFDLGLRATKRTVIDVQMRSDKAKAAGLRWPGSGAKVDRFHYMFLISTLGEARGRGLSSELIRRFQARCVERGDGLPIWAESTTEASRRVYLKCGFRDVETFRVGVGKVGADGLRKEGGEGVPLYMIVWFPPGTPGWEDGEKK